jgi:hypothetical protein
MGIKHLVSSSHPYYGKLHADSMVHWVASAHVTCDKN